MKNDLLYLKELRIPELTTKMLLGVLADYANPQKKIHDLYKKGYITPVKQGVYLIAEELANRPYSKELLAQLIYRPSYISLETALSSYGFIPERVTSTTSVCMGRGKSFSTSVGDFKYYHIKEELYPWGVQLKEVFQGVFCQYATPEKALLDFIYLMESKGEFKTQGDYGDYILDSYRLDLKAIQETVSLKKLQKLSDLYPFRNVRWFASELIRRLLP